MIVAHLKADLGTHNLVFGILTVSASTSSYGSSAVPSKDNSLILDGMAAPP